MKQPLVKEASSDSSPALIENAALMIANAKTLDETFALNALFKEAEIRARKKGLVAVEQKALEYRFWVQDKMGEILERMKEEGARADGHGNQKNRSAQKDTPKTLEQLGITKKESSKAQQFHNLPDLQKKQIIENAKKKIDSVKNQAQFEAVSKARVEARKDYLKKLADSVEISQDLADFRTGDFREVLSDVKDVALVLTDPPYPTEFVPLYSDLAKFAARALRPGGSLITMVGHYNLPDVLDQIRQGAGPELKWHWELAQLHRLDRTASQFPKKTLSSWKHFLWFIKGEYKRDWHFDLIPQGTPQKEFDSWQQSVEDILPVIEYYTDPGELIVDPFSGWGSFGIASVMKKRKFVGAELMAERVQIGKGRLAEALSK